jgi:hypothetical protein
MPEIAFGQCAICRQGQLLAVKEIASGKVLLMCDDCESQWASPEEAKSFENALTNEVKVTQASMDDVRAVGWEQYLI